MDAAADVFDFAPYQRIPTVTLETNLALARALLVVRAVSSCVRVDRAARQLGEFVSEIELGNDATAGVALDDAELDEGSAALWTMLRERLSAWQGYEHPCFDAIIDADRSELARLLASGRAKAERARRCIELLFGVGGLRFLRLGQGDQVARTAAILRLASEEQLDEELAALADPELLPALQGWQQAHASVVMLRVLSEDEDELGARRARQHETLRRLTTAYCVTVLALVDPEQPETFAVVRRALRPILVLRTQLSEGRWLAGEEERHLCDDLYDDSDEHAPACGGLGLLHRFTGLAGHARGVG